MALNNDIVVNDDGQLLGEPTESALCEATQSAGLLKVDAETRLPRINKRVLIPSASV